MLILATFERYTWIVKRKTNVSAKARPLSVLILVIVATGIRIPAALALTVSHFPECPDFFRTLAVDVLPWVKESTFYAAFDLYGMAFLQTFLPFVTLFSLNFVIIRKLCKFNSKSRRSSFAMLPGIRPSLLSSLRRYKMPGTVRSAIYTMVLPIYFFPYKYKVQEKHLFIIKFIITKIEDYTGI
ncbi:unnamed protein product [Strongylus vulgaris]|uniref:G-protein coupled receptors family 1 profile domain-containing protein n=1 Tax=Strongylus vulgaris TaxID=40348 RepID=A0A3P7KCY0_STRVU|nr:unnamed protein product [Strongylus vulgaris]